MPKFPQLSAKEVIAVLNKIGFICKRQRGSHMFFEHPDGRQGRFLGSRHGRFLGSTLEVEGI